jgi:hypothetical protein
MSDNQTSNLYYSGSTYYFFIGLFGYDTTDLLYYCSFATNYCDYAKYSTNYDGWAIGSYWYIIGRINITASYDWYDFYMGFCLDDYSCFGVENTTSTDRYNNTVVITDYHYVYVSKDPINAYYAPYDENDLGRYWYNPASFYYFGYGFDEGYFFTVNGYSMLWPYDP